MTAGKVRTIRWWIVGVVVALIAVPLAGAAADVFTDVPASNVFHDDITWLANSGVTKGCNPPSNTEFCPSDNVTREQMAAFMHRLATSGVVDARTVGGKPLGGIAFVEGTSGAQSGQLSIPYETATRIEEITVPAISAGFLFIQADASYRGGPVDIIQWLQLDDSVCEATSEKAQSVDFSYASLTTGGDRQTASNGAVVPVGQGSHTLTLCVRTASGTGGTRLLDGTSLEAIFFGSGKVETPLWPSS